MAVLGSRRTAQVPSANLISELARRRLPARPCLAGGIKAGLIPLGRVDPFQANVGAGYALVSPSITHALPVMAVSGGAFQ
jgi:hypothetical protein